MTSDDITKSQGKAIREALFSGTNYLYRLKTRMRKRASLAMTSFTNSFAPAFIVDKESTGLGRGRWLPIHLFTLSLIFLLTSTAKNDYFSFFCFWNQCDFGNSRME